MARQEARGTGETSWAATATVACLTSLPGSRWLGEWPPDRSTCGEPSFVVVLISLPRDQNAQTMHPSPKRAQSNDVRPRLPLSRSIIITTLSSRLSQSIFLHCISYGCHLPSLLLHLRCEHERESTLECWELNDDPYSARQLSFSYTRLTLNHHRNTYTSTSTSG
jgi:hypothetical protein